MASNPPQPGNQGIVATALDVARQAQGRPYTWGGHSTNGFDCSGFVIYTLRQAMANGGWTFITAGQIFADRRFIRVTEPQPGDLICFPRGRGTPSDHVGIVVDARSWIGSQSSTGVARVRMDNGWWGRKTHFFLRLR